VPFPAAVDDHQTVNAGYLVDQGAAVLIADRDLTPQRLCETLTRLCTDRVQLLEMAIRARELAQPRAAQDLAEACLHYTAGAA
jgi:UDP-N-acetylglucosamine--N-acetylmuramyl-(pentapeptide) pyrophosphoryl-undecaprenol N-acetylglucosamine transferase